MDCACTVGVEIYDYDTVILIGTNTPIAKKEHICSECCRTIRKGEEYLTEFFVHHDNASEKGTSHKTCNDCRSLRSVFFSDGWYYGQMWEQMHAFVNECDGDVSVECILMLTKTAMDKVLDMVEEQWEI